MYPLIINKNRLQAISMMTLSFRSFMHGRGQGSEMGVISSFDVGLFLTPITVHVIL